MGGEYNRIAVDPDFLELARQRETALHNEASALRHARTQERKKWQGVVASKDREWQNVVAGKDREWQGVIASKDAEIERLRAELRAKS